MIPAEWALQVVALKQKAVGEAGPAIGIAGSQLIVGCVVIVVAHIGERKIHAAAGTPMDKLLWKAESHRLRSRLWQLERTLA